jgi:hypothetical protein
MELQVPNGVAMELQVLPGCFRHLKRSSMFPTPHICERQRVSERSPPLPPDLYLGKAFLGRKFVEYGDGILGQMFANCAKFCTTESRETLTEVSLYLLQPSYRSSKVYRHEVGLNEGLKIEKTDFNDEWT